MDWSFIGAMFWGAAMWVLGWHGPGWLRALRSLWQRRSEPRCRHDSVYPIQIFPESGAATVGCRECGDWLLRKWSNPQPTSPRSAQYSEGEAGKSGG